MPNTAQGIKRVRQNIRRRSINRHWRSRLSTSIRRVRDALSSQAKSDTVASLYRSMTSIADSSARKGIIHRNRAARLKQRLNRMIRQSTSGS